MAVNLVFRWRQPGRQDCEFETFWASNPKSLALRGEQHLGTFSPDPFYDLRLEALVPGLARDQYGNLLRAAVWGSITGEEWPRDAHRSAEQLAASAAILWEEAVRFFQEP